MPIEPPPAPPVPQPDCPAGPVLAPSPDDLSDLSEMPAPEVSAGNPLATRRRMHNVLPFFLSVCLHAGLLILGFVTFKAIEITLAPPQEQIIIPDATIIENAPVGGIPNPGLGEDPLRAAAQANLPDEPAAESGWAERPSERLTAELAGAGDHDTSAMIAIGGQTSFGRGDAIGSGAGEGGELALFGVPGGGGGLGPAAPFVGMSGNARKVIYLCDATGTMLNKFHLLKFELRRAIDVLKPIQAFNVIFFVDGSNTSAADPQRLLVANPDNRRKAFEFIDKAYVYGATDPIPALRMAFRQNPELIYFLTDGIFDNLVSNEQVYQEIRRLNADGRVRINTVAFIDRGDEYEQWLRKVASENGGTFKFVSEDDLAR
jgi:hypothetical protein